MLNFICNLECGSAFIMSELELIIEYQGEVAFESIDPVLDRLKKLPAYQAIKIPIRKRVYSIFVECMENIYKYAVTHSFNINTKVPESFIFLGIQDEKYIINAGNVVQNQTINELRNRLEQINQLNKTELKALYADIINKELLSDVEGAGLGLITIALKTENDIKYTFNYINDQYSYFEMKISV